MEFYGTIQNGEIVLPSIQLKLRQQYLTSMKDGARIRETLTKMNVSKTYQQVKAYFGLAVEMIRQRMIEMGVDVCGIAPNKEMIHEILKRACGGVGEQGETLGLSEMSIDQASRFFENTRVWAATQLALDIPNPDINWKEQKGRKNVKSEEIS